MAVDAVGESPPMQALGMKGTTASAEEGAEGPRDGAAGDELFERFVAALARGDAELATELLAEKMGTSREAAKPMVVARLCAGGCGKGRGTTS